MLCNTKEVETTPTVGLTDLDYVEDIISYHMEQAQELLNRVESVCQVKP